MPIVVGTTLNGRFELLKELGRGGMGVVYRARDSLLDRSVAVKVLKEIKGEQVGQRIRLEAQILARLVHEHIVRLYDLNVDAGVYYFIMEEVDGPSFFKRWRALELPERLRILCQVAMALDYAHRQGVIHRDVKPGNVLLTVSDVPKLSDFGLSVFADQMPEATGLARGTPTYMSPEQAAGRRITHRTDLYSLGIMLYECTTGSPPFQGPAASVMAQHLSVEPEPIRTKFPTADPALEALILALLTKRPEQRPASGRDVADALLDLLAAQRVGPAAGDGRVSLAPRTGVRPAAPGEPTRAATPPAAPPRAESTHAGPVPPLPSEPTVSEAARGATAARSTTHAPAIAVKPGRALVLSLVEAVAAEPIPLRADERYLCGHYLAYLLGGSRRQGFLMRRPLDPLNADRARLLLAMAALCLHHDHAVKLGQAAELLDKRIECRPWLSPVVVMKYLAARSSPDRRRAFRETRQQLQTVSEYALAHLTDERGVLNPGLMPQRLDDLQRMAPTRVEVDDELVRRWNTVSDVWRGNREFRAAVLRYATTNAWREPASIDLWPEVVYPLIERARRQRIFRSRFEAVWDLLCGRILHVADAGVKLDRAFARAVPRPVILQLDDQASQFTDEMQLRFEEAPPADLDPDQTVSRTIEISRASFADLSPGDDEPDRYLVPLTQQNAVRLNLGELRALWKEAIAALRSAGASGGQRAVSVGPYRLAVVATIRVRNAGQVAIQGMPNKQVELLVPSFTGGGSNDRPVVAAWPYQNNSLLVTHYDHMSNRRYVLWDAAQRKQFNFDSRSELERMLFELGLEPPDHLDEALSKNYAL